MKRKNIDNEILVVVVVVAGEEEEHQRANLIMGNILQYYYKVTMY